jgi:hypothetical protein
MLVGDAAADRGVGRVEEQDFHGRREGLILGKVAAVLMLGYLAALSLCITKYMTHEVNKVFKAHPLALSGTAQHLSTMPILKQNGAVRRAA